MEETLDADEKDRQHLPDFYTTWVLFRFRSVCRKQHEERVGFLRVRFQRQNRHIVCTAPDNFARFDNQSQVSR